MPKISTCFGFRVVGLDGQLSITDKTGHGEKNSMISFTFFEKSCDVNFNLDCLIKTCLFTLTCLQLKISSVTNLVLSG